MKRAWLAVMTLISAAAFACSGSNGSSGGSGVACASQAPDVNTACISCAESHCGSQLGTFNSGCADLINCQCPGGKYDSSAVCSSQEAESGCMSAASSLVQCEEQVCGSACNGSGSGSGGGSGSGSGGALSNFSCTIASGVECEQFSSIPASVLADEQAICSSSSGTAATSCPASGLVGCCIQNASVAVCYYDASVAMTAHMSCASPYMWTTSVP